MADKIKRKIRIALAERGKTQTDLADHLGVTRQYVSMLINGREQSHAMRARIARFLKIPNPWKE